MLYQLIEDGNIKTLKEVQTGVSEFKEINLEDTIVKSENELGTELDRDDILDNRIFGEYLLYLERQSKTSNDKKSDILALDLEGNSVIIELKKDKARLGVETQALQYLADFSKYKGKNFIKQFFLKQNKDPMILSSFFEGFNQDYDEDNLNNESSIILVAQEFDATLFSMGEWLSSKGVSFKCIQYKTFKIENYDAKHEFIDFSVVFDRSTKTKYPLIFNNDNSINRKPTLFWHNIGVKEQSWWEYLINSNQITASFENKASSEDKPEEQCKGYKLLHKYKKGDRIIAYASGYGAIGYGIIPEFKYSYIRENTKDDILENHTHRHRLDINWLSCVNNLHDGIKPDILKNTFKIAHPLSTSTKIPEDKGEKLINVIIENFKKYN